MRFLSLALALTCAVTAPAQEARINAKLLGKPIIQDADPAISFQIQPASDQHDDQITRVDVYINDFLFQTFQGKELALRKDNLAIPRSLLRSGENRLFVHAVSKNNARKTSDSVLVSMKRPPAAPQFHGLFVGIGNYRKSSPRLRDISCHFDVEVTAHYFKEHSKDRYKKSNIRLLNNDKVTAAALLAELKKLAGAHPDDLVMIHLAGHALQTQEIHNAIKKGVLQGKGGFSPLEMKSLQEELRRMDNIAFCFGDYNLKNLSATTLSFSHFYEHLARIPCQKVIFLDHCGAANYADSLIRRLPSKDVGPIVFQACGANEGNLEIENAFFKEDAVGSVFCQAVLYTLGRDFAKADKNMNKSLEAQELHNHIEFLIPRWLGQLKKDLEADGQRDSARLLEPFPHPTVFVPDSCKDIVLFGPRK